MKTIAFFVTLALALPLAAQSTTGNGTPQRKRDGTGSATTAGTQLRKRDGSCGNPNPSGSRGAGQGARKGQGR